MPCGKPGKIVMSVMKPLAEYSISFSGLKIGQHDFEYTLEDAFFQEFAQADFRNANVHLDVVLDKRDTMLTFDFTFEGKVETDCDRCGDPLKLQVKGSNHLIVKFGEEEFEQTDEIVVIHESEHQLNIAQYAYEYIVLSMPHKRVHEEGYCNATVLAKLEEHSIDEQDDSETDPRWAALKQLKNKN